MKSDLLKTPVGKKKIVFLDSDNEEFSTPLGGPTPLKNNSKNKLIKTPKSNSTKKKSNQINKFDSNELELKDSSANAEYLTASEGEDGSSTIDDSFNEKGKSRENNKIDNKNNENDKKINQIDNEISDQDDAPEEETFKGGKNKAKKLRKTILDSTKLVEEKAKSNRKILEDRLKLQKIEKEVRKRNNNSNNMKKQADTSNSTNDLELSPEILQNLSEEDFKLLQNQPEKVVKNKEEKIHIKRTHKRLDTEEKDKLKSIKNGHINVVLNSFKKRKLPPAADSTVSMRDSWLNRKSLGKIPYN